jgi:hypothetical protein
MGVQAAGGRPEDDVTLGEVLREVLRRVLRNSSSRARTLQSRVSVRLEPGLAQLGDCTRSKPAPQSKQGMEVRPSVSLVLQRDDRCFNTRTTSPGVISKPATHVGPCHVASRHCGPSSLVISKPTKHMPLPHLRDPLPPGFHNSGVSQGRLQGTAMPSRISGIAAQAACASRVSEAAGQ